MEPQTAPTARTGRNLKPLYWLAAAAMAIAMVLEWRTDHDLLQAASRGALLIALIMLGTAKSAETRGWKVVIYLLIAVALGLFIADKVR